MQSYALKGGLDLSTNKVAVDPGTLQDCLNYEVADVDGYSRISGFERFDGQFRMADMRYLRLRGALTSGTFKPGDQVMVGASPAYVTAGNTGDTWALYAIMHSRESWPLSLPAVVTNLARPGAAQATACDLLPGAVGKQSVVNVARKALVDAARPLVGLVPGNPSTPVAGVFWFKDRLYAIRDYPLIWFESATSFPFQIGGTVTLPGGVYTIIDIHYTSETYQSGYMLLWPIDQDGIPMTVPPVEGSFITRPGSFTGFDMGGAAMGELPIAMLGGLSYGDAEAQITSAGDDGAHLTAALWEATATGWQPVDLQREVQFTGGTPAFETFITNNVGLGAAPITTSPLAGSSARLNGADVTAAVAAADGTDAALSGAASDDLRVTGFDLSAIPDTATILGIQVSVTRHADDGAKCADATVELIGLDGISNNKARAAEWETAATAVSYGGAADTWGNAHLSPAVIKGVGFGVRLATRAVDVTPSGGIDAVSVAITYRRRDGVVYAHTSSADVELSLVDVQLITGNWADSDGAGWLVLGLPGGGAATLGADMEIRSAAAGGGDLLATTASTDQPIRLAGWNDLQEQASQYQFVCTNFYGEAEYEGVYGVSGAAPAFTYDGHRCMTVRTPLDPAQDMPRHIAQHGSSLVLGYQPGAYILSAVGDPTNFRGEDDAASIEIGEPLTNLLPAMSDALLITSPSKTLMLQGLTPDTYQQNTVSANRGAIEYTGADVGRLLTTDTMGVAGTDATDAFGDLVHTYLSENVQSWLGPRLHSTLGADSVLQQPICALPVRRTNQYRLYFRDGYVMTMTANDTPAFMLQRYYQPSGDPDLPDEPFPLSTACTGVDSVGRERVFGSFDADANRGYVFEFDHGNSFDGQPIPAYFVLNPLSFSETMTLKRFDRMFLLGQAEGFARPKLSRAVNYGTPDGTPATSFAFGDPSAAAGRRPVRGIVDAPIEGYEVTVRIDSTTDQEGPHIVQAIATDADDRGDSRGHVRG